MKFQSLSDLSQNGKPPSIADSDTVDMVSIVIPTFNRAALVVKAVESALQQTHPAREIVVVDDGSTDDTRARLQPFQGQIRYFYQPNRGASAAQNQGIALARGKWISILASDDLWLPRKLEAQIRAVSKLGPTFGACFTDCTFSGDPRNVQGAFAAAGLRCNGECSSLDDPFPCVLGRQPALWVQSMLVLRSLLDAANRFDEKLPVAEDTDLIFRLASRTRFGLVAEPLVVIDRDPTHSRLSDLFNRLEERRFSSKEYLYRKWLDLPEVQSPLVRVMIEKQLRSAYYDRAVYELKRLRPAAAFKTIRLIGSLGHTLPDITTQLLTRASRALRTPARL